VLMYSYACARAVLMSAMPMGVPSMRERNAWNDVLYVPLNTLLAFWECDACVQLEEGEVLKCSRYANKDIVEQCA
jgi:hypothetical protein